MKIEAKNVKTIRGNEGDAWDATIYLNGKSIGYAVYDGWGGPIQTRGLDQKALAEIEAYAKSLPARHIPQFDMMLDVTVDTLIEDAVIEFLTLRDLKRALSTKVLAKRPDGKVIQWSKKQQGRDVSVALIKQIEVKNPDYVILNNLPEADALVIWKTVAT